MTCTGTGAGGHGTELGELRLNAEVRGSGADRASPTWLDATAIHSLKDQPEYTSHLFLLHDGADCLCIYPVSSTTAICCLERGTDPAKPLNVKVRSATAGDGKAAVVIVRGGVQDAASLPAAAVAAARQWLFNGQPVPFKPYPRGPFEGLGCCTWSSLGEDVHPTESNLADLVDKYVAAEIPIQSFIIDDGWQNQRTFARGDASGFNDYWDRQEKGKWQRRGLWDFNAHPDLGAGGLAGAVKMIQNKFATVDGTGHTDVGVWITLTGGYWDGINPDSPLVKKYNCKPYRASRSWWPGVPNEWFTVAYMPGGSVDYWLPSPETAAAFWSDWFTILRAAGVTFIKVDNQATLTSLDGAEGAALNQTLWKTLVAAADETFGPAHVIHCMANSEGMFGGAQGLGLITQGDKFVWRNSDDFGMEHRQRDAHQQQIFTNLANTLVTNHTAIVPDADMWMTAAQHPVTHGFLRALFPGPMLLTDKPGQHDASILWRVIARDRTGVARVVKTANGADPLNNRLFDLSILDSEKGTGQWASVKTPTGAIIGVFNVRGNDTLDITVHDALTTQDVVDAAGGTLDGEWAVLQADLHIGGMSAGTVLTAKTNLNAPVELPPVGAAGFWIAPLKSTGTASVAVLGLVDQFAGMVAVENSTIVDSECT